MQSKRCLHHILTPAQKLRGKYPLSGLVLALDSAPSAPVVFHALVLLFLSHILLESHTSCRQIFQSVGRLMDRMQKYPTCHHNSFLHTHQSDEDLCSSNNSLHTKLCGSMQSTLGSILNIYVFIIYIERKSSTHCSLLKCSQQLRQGQNICWNQDYHCGNIMFAKRSRACAIMHCIPGTSKKLYWKQEIQNSNQHTNTTIWDMSELSGRLLFVSQYLPSPSEYCGTVTVLL